MTIVLNHTIVPARNKKASARIFAQLFGLSFEGHDGHFAPVRVNGTHAVEKFLMRPTGSGQSGSM